MSAVDSTHRQIVAAIDAEWEATHSKHIKTTRVLRRQGTDDAVKRTILDSLKDMTSEELDANRDPDGNTGREVLTVRKRLNRSDPKAFPMGKNFYCDFRLTFLNKNKPKDFLIRGENDGSISTQLLEGMVAFKKTGNRAPFASCLQFLVKVSRADVLGILRWGLDLKPCQHNDHMRFALDVVRCVQRLEWAEHFTFEVSVVTPWMDNTLCFLYSKTKGADAKPSAFIAIHADVVYAVLPREDVGIILAHKGPFGDIKHNLIAVVQSKIGQSLFGGCLHGVLSEVVRDMINEALTELLKTDLITLQDVREAQVGIHDKIMAIGYMALLPDKRFVGMSYRGRPFTKAVKCLMQQVDDTFAASLRGRATACGDLVPLFCENDLADPAFAGVKGQIDDEVLAPWKNARSRANSGLGQSKDSATILAFLKQTAMSLVAVDRTIEVDIAFMKAMEGEAGTDAMQKKVISKLPCPGKTVDLAKVSAELQKFQKSDMCVFCGEGAQGSLATVLSYLQALMQGRRPAFAVNVDGFLANVKLSLQYFCTAEIGDKVVMGNDAVQHYYKIATEKRKAGDLCLSDTEALAKFNWLLSEEQMKHYNEIMQMVVEKTKQDLGVAVQKLSAGKRPSPDAGKKSGASSSSSTSKKAKTETKHTDEVAAALAYFNA